MKRIVVLLPSNRSLVGQLFVYDEDHVCFGPVAALGKADGGEAAAHGNPSRDPAKPFGDTPTGQFIGSLRYEENTPHDLHSFGNPDWTGKIPIIHLQPLNGDSDAWRRQMFEGAAVDVGLAIHSGAPGGFGELRPTFGCVRVKQGDRDAILAQLAGLPTFQVEIKTSAMQAPVQEAA